MYVLFKNSAAVFFLVARLQIKVGDRCAEKIRSFEYDAIIDTPKAAAS